MFIEVGQEEYMEYMKKHISIKKYNLLNNSDGGYRICCIDKNDKTIAYRERDAKGNFQNYILEEE